jgi:spore coat protein U-like protein
VQTVKRIVFGLAVGAAIAGPLAQHSMLAASATANVTVSATVANNCTISGGALAFGSYDPLVAGATDGAGTFTVACTKGASGVTIDLGTGQNYAAGRKMTSGSATLDYQLYSDSSRTTVWGSAAGGSTLAVSAPTSKAPVSYTVYGRITGGQDVAAGNYSDSIVATVNF